MSEAVADGKLGSSGPASEGGSNVRRTVVCFIACLQRLQQRRLRGPQVAAALTRGVTFGPSLDAWCSTVELVFLERQACSTRR